MIIRGAFLFFLLLHFLNNTLSFSQCPTPDFDIPTSACIDQNITATNNSSNAISYKWDLCSDDLSVIPNAESVLNNNEFFRARTIKVIKESSNWYGFAISQSSNNLIKLSFGQDLNNIPTFENLGNPNGLLQGAFDLDAINIDGTWNLIVANTSGGNLINIEFKDGIENNNPTTTDLGNFGVISNPNHVLSLYDKGKYYLFVSNSDQLIKLKFENNLLEDNPIVEVVAVSGSTTLRGLSLLKTCDTWVGVLLSYNNKLFSLNFGDKLDNAPAINPLNTTGMGLSFPSNIALVQESSNFHGFVQGALGVFHRIDFIGDIINFDFTATQLSVTEFTSNSNFALDLVQEESQLHIFNFNLDQKNLVRVDFQNNCGNSSPIRTEYEPVFSYSSAGIYSITLTASDTLGNSSTITKEINITSDNAPTGNLLLNESYCIANEISFEFSTTDTIVSYAWDFGDGNSSTAVSPSHQYASAGGYTITLALESDNGCTNTYAKELEILAEPVPEFSTTKTEYCTFEAIDFLNTTIGDYSETINWYWDFNGEGSSIEENPSFIFETEGTKTIVLEANVLGCIQTFQTTLSVIDGPQPDFTYDSNCLGEDIQFTNLSNGANITNYAWDFGNGETSTEENPLTNFAVPGEYEVNLTVRNASGCENSTAQTILVFEQVIDSILFTEAIENLPFTASIDWLDSFDSTQNLSYQWVINSNIQSNETAEFTLSAGEYELQLQVTTASGCVFNKAKNINVKVSEFPTANFDLQSEACLNELVSTENSSINTENYEWDFCIGDFDSTAVLANSTPFNANNSKGMELVYHNDNYFGFVLKGSNLFRLDFGSSLISTPTIVDLGDLKGTLLNPEAIVIMENYNGNWVAFIGHLDVDYGITRVNFGHDITNNFPTYENIGVLNPGRTRGLDLVKDQGNYFLLASGYNNDKFAILKLNASLEASFDINDISIYGRYSQLDLPTGITTLNHDGNWLVYIVSQGNGNLTRFNFGSNFDNTPLLEENYSLGLESAKKIRIFNELDNYYAIIGSDTSPITVWDLNNLNSSSITKINQPNLPSNFSFSFSNRPSGRYLNLISSNYFQSILFEANCSASINSSLIKNPTISYSQPGTYPITLTAYHPNGNSASITKEITVTNNQAPDISFSTGENLCISNPIDFSSATKGVIATYDWDFGDGTQSSLENPSHTYASAGTYAVKLNVTDTAGCNNLFVDSIRVFEEPVPDFQAAAQGSLCSQKPLIFENLTVLPTEASFFWDFGDGNTSTNENPEHVYAAAGDYIVSQSINMAGCAIEKIDTITINPGPSVAFQVANTCLGEILQFENTSQGDFLAGFEWDFGDGTQSTQTNPNHRYDTAGVYNVLLTAFTTNGCDFTISQSVEIQPLAEVAFESDVACAGQPTLFAEQVNIAQSNITDYLWDFGVAGTQSDISTDANPTYSYLAAGSYEVSLQVTTSDGCTSSTTQMIIVNSIPEATFEFEQSCLGETRLFSPLNTTNSIAHFWELQNSQGEVIQSSQSESFSFLFIEAGTYQLTYRQENANLCSNTTTQTFSINELPVPNFSWGIACTGEAIAFENLTNLNGNSIKNYRWMLNEEVISTNAQLNYTFENSGEYSLSLEVETQNGCIESISKTIDISAAPSAFFELEQNVGAYPFEINLNAEEYEVSSIEYRENSRKNRVQGTGNSDWRTSDFTLPTSNFQLPTSLNFSTRQLVNSSTYFWTLNGDTISSTPKLNYIIEQPGTYLLGLIVTNEAGCTDNHYEQIRVREPRLDLSLSNLRINEDGEFTTFILNISNRGSLVPERIDLDINLGSYSLTETLSAPLYPEKNRNFSLSLKLTEEQLNGLSKICINAIPIAGAHQDSNMQNNRICTNLESEYQILNAYPNPAINQFTVPLIVPESGSMRISMEDANGRQVKVFNYELEAGYNELQIQRDNVSSGIYFLRFRYQGQEKVQKIIFR
ncbi:PKD domain-containing protein [Marivirga sp.]|uniref:PKD domain-containing protein n=1 Tax=Marivirga sp. TaxID=2018662 RepID=UPI002D7F52A4|nr:PKD domain-containing protein [Marivirga sp.]HET8861522.1 PKD domain-containing protein [Marivirga sp.]